MFKTRHIDRTKHFLDVKKLTRNQNEDHYIRNDTVPADEIAISLAGCTHVCRLVIDIDILSQMANIILRDLHDLTHGMLADRESRRQIQTITKQSLTRKVEMGSKHDEMKTQLATWQDRYCTEDIQILGNEH